MTRCRIIYSFIALLAALCMLSLLTSCGQEAGADVSLPEAITTPQGVSVSSDKDEATTTTTTEKAADGAADKVTTTKATEGTTSTTVKKTTSTTKKVTTTTKKKATTTKKPAVVQAADPNTGISWDGKSPIVYTYTDGSTGTTPKDGAKYEVAPGLVREYTAPTAVRQKTCSRCGKEKSSNPGPNVCVRWLMGAVDCPNCGVHVEPHTCHTCK